MIVERRAVRALVLRNREDILLLRVADPAGAPFWFAPGGGIEDGEEAEDGLRRELFEELGLADIDVGPIVWLRHHTFDWGGRRSASNIAPSASRTPRSLCVRAARACDGGGSTSFSAPRSA